MRDLLYGEICWIRGKGRACASTVCMSASISRCRLELDRIEDEEEEGDAAWDLFFIFGWIFWHLILGAEGL